MNSYMCAHICVLIYVCSYMCAHMCVQIYRHTFGLKSDRCMHAQSHTMTTVNHMRISYNEVTYDNRVCKHYSNMFTHLYILIWVHIYEYTYINTHISVHIRVHIFVYSYMCKYIHCAASDFDLETNGLGLDVCVVHPFSPIVLLCADRSSFWSSRLADVLGHRVEVSIATSGELAEIWLRSIWVTTKGVWRNWSLLLRWNSFQTTHRKLFKRLYFYGGWVCRHDHNREMITDVLCVGTHYLPITVCGNGRTREEFDHVLHVVVLPISSKDNVFGTTWLKIIGIELSTRTRYDIIRYDSILCHANTTVDPSTGHMLQTLQMISLSTKIHIT